MRARRLATGSTRDTDWQREEYARLMGKEKAGEQERAAKLERGECVCARRTLRTSQGYRTIHQRDCVKFKDWMLEHLVRIEGDKTAQAFVNSMSTPSEP